MSDEILINCWYCTMEYDLITAEWCKCNAEQPSKVCPYCLKCFCEASDEYRKEIWAKAPESIKNEKSSFLTAKDKLGDLLISKGLLTTEQLLKALKVQKDTQKKLGEVLIDLKYITEHEIISVLSDQFDLVQIDLDMSRVPDPDIFRYISFDFCYKNCVVPIDLQYIGGRRMVYIAVTSPPNKETIQKVREITGFQVYPYLAMRASIMEYLEILKSKIDTKPRSVKLSSSITRMFEDLIKKFIEYNANIIQFIKEENNPYTVKIRYCQNIISNLSLDDKIYSEIKAYLFKLAGMDKERINVCSSGDLKIKMANKNIHFIIIFNIRDKAESIELYSINKRQYLEPVSQWDISEKDLMNIKSNFLKPNGLSLIIGSSEIDTLKSLYSIHCNLIEKGCNVLSAQSLRPYSIDGIEYIKMGEDEQFDDMDISAQVINADYISLDKNPFNSFNDIDNLFQLLKNKQMIGIIHKEKVMDFFQILYDRELLTKDIIDHLNFIICQKIIKRICSRCRKPMNLNPRMLKSLGLKDDEIPGLRVFKGAGCTYCQNTGFYGELILHKVVDFPINWKEDILSRPDFDIDTIRNNLPASNIRNIGLNFVNEGIITLSEMLKNI